MKTGVRIYGRRTIPRGSALVVLGRDRLVDGTAWFASLRVLCVLIATTPKYGNRHAVLNTVARVVGRNQQILHYVALGFARHGHGSNAGETLVLEPQDEGLGHLGIAEDAVETWVDIFVIC